MVLFEFFKLRWRFICEICCESLPFITLGLVIGVVMFKRYKEYEWWVILFSYGVFVVFFVVLTAVIVFLVDWWKYGMWR